MVHVRTITTHDSRSLCSVLILILADTRLEHIKLVFWFQSFDRRAPECACCERLATCL